MDATTAVCVGVYALIALLLVWCAVAAMSDR